MKHELSILIPNYNGDCRRQVHELLRQAEAIDGLDFEIVVADDGSTDEASLSYCREIADLPHCRFIERGVNSGRAVIRNYLCSEARYEWLLFMDCDMEIVNDRFLLNYLEHDDADVIYGGYVVGNGDPSCLRYVYEKACEHEHTAVERNKRPYQHFHTCNFLVRHSVMTAYPFDERFRNYGYEDVLFGKHLRQAGISIAHIDNPAGFYTFEDNAHFVSKTEEGLRTLCQYREELRGYSRMLTFYDGIHLGVVKSTIRLWHRLFGRIERYWLCHRKPSLLVFRIYKLGYFLVHSS